MQVITLKNIEEFCSPNQQTLIIQSGQIITPSAKDWLQNKGIQLIYGDSSSNSSSLPSSCKQENQEQLITRITHLLINKYGITDPSILSTIVAKVMQNII